MWTEWMLVCGALVALVLPLAVAWLIVCPASGGKRQGVATRAVPPATAGEPVLRSATLPSRKKPS